MLKWILYRVLLILPTLFLVLVLSFVLSKSVHNDPVEASLTLRGVSTDTPHGQKEYEALYYKMGLQKPLLYFAILPHYYPNNIHSFHRIYDRTLIKNLLNKKVHSDWIIEYLSLKDELLKDTDLLLEHIGLKEDLEYANELDQLKSLKSKLDNVEVGQSKIKKLVSHLQIIDKNIQKMYYPTLRWHGMENQFHRWMSRYLVGDWGISYKDGIEVKKKVGQALKWTLVLTFMSLLLTTFISYAVGLITSYYSHTWIDRLLTFLGLVFYTMPVFWLAALMITFLTTDRYGAALNIFPLPGRWYIPEGESFWVTLSNYAYQMVLPIICLVANDISPISQLIRRNILSQKEKPYVLFSRAKGLTPFQSFKSHLLPHSYTTMVTIIGGKIPSLLSGSLIIEVIFNIPGIGRLIYDSVLTADWNVVFGVLTLVSFVVIVAMLVTDILYRWIDPRTLKSMP